MSQFKKNSSSNQGKQSPSPEQNIPEPPVEVIQNRPSKPKRELSKENIFLRKFNDFSALFALLVGLIATLVIMLPLSLTYPITDITIFFQYYIDPLVRIILAATVVIYDAAYARNKILRMEFGSYGIDLIVMGAFGLLAWFSGIFLIVKGFIVLFMALEDKANYPQLYGSFWDSANKAANVVGGLYGAVVISLNLSIYFIPSSNPITNIYAYIALFAVIFDLAVLVPINWIKKQKGGNYALAIGFIVAGILACFFPLDPSAGFLIIAQGVIIFFVAVFSVD